MLDGFFIQTGHHINVNVFDRDLLLDAMNHPEKYPQLTIRVSGYAVNFIKLTREQQLEVIHRTIHEKNLVLVSKNMFSSVLLSSFVGQASELNAGLGSLSTARQVRKHILCY